MFDRCRPFAADNRTPGEASVPCAQLEHDALLSDIFQDFDQVEDFGPDIINKRWSLKLNEVKLKEKINHFSEKENGIIDLEIQQLLGRGYC